MFGQYAVALISKLPKKLLDEHGHESITFRESTYCDWQYHDLEFWLHLC